jgi:hypothetical protein
LQEDTDAANARKAAKKNNCFRVFFFIFEIFGYVKRSDFQISAKRRAEKVYFNTAFKFAAKIRELRLGGGD